MTWFAAYLVTCAIEIPLVVFLVWTLSWRPRVNPVVDKPSDPGRRGAALARITILAWALQCTHPLLWLAHPVDLPGTVAGEIIVALAEGLVLSIWAAKNWSFPFGAKPYRGALVVSVIANAASFAAGLAWSLIRVRLNLA